MFENGETHRCGNCANPTGVYNKECPGRRKGIPLVGAPRRLASAGVPEGAVHHGRA